MSAKIDIDITMSTRIIHEAILWGDRTDLDNLPQDLFDVDKNYIKRNFGPKERQYLLDTILDAASHQKDTVILPWSKAEVICAIHRSWAFKMYKITGRNPKRYPNRRTG